MKETKGMKKREVSRNYMKMFSYKSVCYKSESLQFT